MCSTPTNCHEARTAQLRQSHALIQGWEMNTISVMYQVGGLGQDFLVLMKISAYAQEYYSEDDEKSTFLSGSPLPRHKLNGSGYHLDCMTYFELCMGRRFRPLLPWYRSGTVMILWLVLLQLAQRMLSIRTVSADPAIVVLCNHQMTSFLGTNRNNMMSKRKRSSPTNNLETQVAISNCATQPLLRVQITSVYSAVEIQ